MRLLKFQKFLTSLIVAAMASGYTFSARAQTDTYIGPTSVHTSMATTYSYTFTAAEGPFISPSWHITGGTVTKSLLSPDNMTFTARVTWGTSTGRGTLYILENFDVDTPTLSVTIGTCGTLGTPGTPTAASSSVCSGGSTTVSATVGTGGSTIQWSTTSGGASIGTGNPLTVTPAVTTTYYANSYSPTYSCTSASSSGPVTVTVNAKPTTPYISTPLPVYGSGSTVLTCYPNESGESTRWRNTPTGAVAGTGYTYSTPSISAATQFYASSYYTATGCESALATIIVTPLAALVPASQIRQIIRTPATTDAVISTLGTSKKTTVYNYVDGLGRVNQQIIGQGTPQATDLVQPYEYDQAGRASKSYLPYTKSALSTGAYQTTYTTDQATFYTSSVSNKVADDVNPYAVSTYEPSTLGRISVQGNVGTNWQPSTNHTKQYVYAYNTGATSSDEDEVRLLAADGSSTGFFAANVLSKVSVADENGHKDIVFSDVLGRTIVHKQQLDGTINGSTVGYLQTYYVYNDMNKLVYIIPPAGLAALKANSWILSATILDQHLHQFVYDKRGRLTQKKTPGQAWIYYGYDIFNRLVLTQDGNLRPLNKWNFVKYDSKGRPVMSGLYTNATRTTLASVQTMLTNLYSSGATYEDRGTTLHGYTNVSFPSTNADGSALEMYSVNYYDSYDFDYNGVTDYSYDSTQVADSLKVPSMLYRLGMPTGSKKIIVGTSTWLYSYVFYDTKGRTLQIRTNNHLSSAINNLVSMVYDFEGKVKQTITYHNAGGTNQTTVKQRPVYDFMGRVYQANHTINSAAEQLLSQYEYNELGQVTAKELHSTGGGSFLQNVDYRYNIRGWLSSVNNAQLSNDGVMNNDTTDYFGMELLYDGADAALGNTTTFNGTISAVKWKGPGNGRTSKGERSYNYFYDKTDKLTGSAFRQYGTSSWSDERNTLNEYMSYDYNGNIQTLRRNQNNRSLSGTTVLNTAQTMDSLLYSYTRGSTGAGNHLGKVADASGIASGFTDGTNTGDDYSYDTLGNMTADHNKGIDSLKYNVLGKVQRIKFSNGNVMVYTYDAAGTKLKVVITSGGTTTTTDYINGFVYQNSVLSFFNSPEGRVVNNGTGLEYQYAIADHQGNTRVVFTSANPTVDTRTAGYENPAEASNFDNYGGYIVSAAAHSGTYSSHLMGDNNSLIAAAKSYHIYSGDKVELNGWFLSTGYRWTNASHLTDYTTFLLSAFLLPTPGVGETHTASAAISAQGTTMASGYDDGSTDNTDAKVFFNILVYDKNFNLIQAKYLQVTDNNTWTNADLSYTATEEAHVYMYISNEATTWQDVYIDDVTMTYTPSRVVQYNEYYPFGLQTAKSWTRTAATSNQFLYNQGSELNASTMLYDLPYRNYDAAIGRFFQVDPKAASVHHLTPYNYGNNNPVLLNDPNGDLVFTSDPGRPLQPGSGGFHNNASDDDTYWSLWDAQEDQAEATYLLNSTGGAISGFTTSSTALISVILNAVKQGVSTNDVYDAVQTWIANPDGEASQEDTPNLLVNPSGGDIRSDTGGDGHWGAPRKGSNTHQGIDLISTSGQSLVAPVTGVITYGSFLNPYGNQTPYATIVPTDTNLGFTSIRLLYITSCGTSGITVLAGEIIGTSANLQTIGYPDNVGQHVHVNMANNGAVVNPTPYFFP